MEEKKVLKLPLIPIRGRVLFPEATLQLDVQRSKSVAALEHSVTNNLDVFFVAQKDIDIENPKQEDIYDLGVVGRVKQILKLPNDGLRIHVDGLYKARILEYFDSEDYISVKVIEEKDLPGDIKTEKAHALHVKKKFFDYGIEESDITREAVFKSSYLDNPREILGTILSDLPVKIDIKQTILEMNDLTQALIKLGELILLQTEISNLEKQIKTKLNENVYSSQKEYYLREQMKIIRDELGDTQDIEDQIDGYRAKLNKLKLKKDIHEKVSKQIDRLLYLNESSPEAGVIRNYVETILDLPWKKQTKERIDLNRARKILDKDHFGLSEVKERIIEYLAIQKLKNNTKGPIICLVGPPGVGKTSIARSIAESLNRKFVRMSLGGVSDESEIRGHRRTYIGSIPGRIINSLKEIQSKNPLFLLDEIDKLSSEFRGDPASALLEVLDPEQNKTFTDRYLELPFDLSKVMFITTANTTATIPRPLLDRMEIIEVSGYTLLEKMQIAKKHLIPKQMRENAVEGNFKVDFTDGAVEKIIDEYTRESGVRNLERTIAKILRKVVAELMETNKKKSMKITASKVTKYLGHEKYTTDRSDKEDKVGVVTGLAWTSVGGDTLQIEVNIMKGNGKLSLTGQLGDVMKESAQAGLSYIRSIADKLNIEDNFFKENDIHIHVPQGSIPKDGPSAGITMATAMVSAITGKKVKANVAMTGEITLRGRVLPIGGLREKVLAAKRYGIDTVIYPKENVGLYSEIPNEIKNGIKPVPVTSMEDVLKVALRK